MPIKALRGNSEKHDQVIVSINITTGFHIAALSHSGEILKLASFSKVQPGRSLREIAQILLDLANVSAIVVSVDGAIPRETLVEGHDHPEVFRIYNLARWLDVPLRFVSGDWLPALKAHHGCQSTSETLEHHYSERAARDLAGHDEKVMQAALLAFVARSNDQCHARLTGGPTDQSLAAISPSPTLH